MNPPSKRPLGITLLALVFLWIGCFGSIALPIGVASAGIGPFEGLISSSIRSANLAAAIVYLGLFVWLSLYVAYAFIGFGLWKLRNWARKAVMGISLFCLALGLVFEPIFVRPVELLVPLLIGLVPFAWLFWYLRRPSMVVVFGGASPMISGPPPIPSKVKKWQIVAAAAAAFALFTCTVWWAGDSMMRKSDVYKNALSVAEKSPCVAAKIGVPFNVGSMIHGSWEESSDKGAAAMSIPLYGRNGSGDLNLLATKTAGSWKFTSLLLVSSNQESKITPGTLEDCR